MLYTCHLPIRNHAAMRYTCVTHALHMPDTWIIAAWLRVGVGAAENAFASFCAGHEIEEACMSSEEGIKEQLL